MPPAGFEPAIPASGRRPTPQTVYLYHTKNTTSNSMFKSKLDKTVTKRHKPILNWKIGKWFREPLQPCFYQVHFAVH
jgi:hypothetical protein